MTEEQSERLLEIYFKCRFQEAIAQDLMIATTRMNVTLLWILVVSVTASLMSGGITILRTPELLPIWATISILSMVASIVGVARSPGDRLYLHFDTARSFGKLASQVESCARFTLHDSDPGEIDQLAVGYFKDYTDLLERTGVEHRNYGTKNAEAITQALRNNLRIEKLIE